MLTKMMPAWVNRTAKRALRAVGYARFKLNSKRISKPVPLDEAKARRALNAYSPPRGEVTTFTHYLSDATLDVSIVIPAYNAEKTIEAALACALGQDVTCSYEVVAVDDCSTDQTLALLQKQSDEKLRVFRMPENGGRAAACRLGLMNARGRYVLFFDADDLLPPNAVQRLLDAARRESAQIAIGQFVTFFEDSGPRYQSERYPAGVSADSKHLWRRYPGYTCMKLYARALWLNACFLMGNHYDDTVLWYVIYPRCAKLVSIQDIVYEYRVSSSGITYSVRGNPRAADAYWAVEALLGWREAHGMHPDEETYRMTLVQLTRYLYSRNRTAPEDALCSMFVLSCIAFKALRAACGEVSLSSMDRALEAALLTGDFGAWRYLCAYYK